MQSKMREFFILSVVAVVSLINVDLAHTAELTLLSPRAMRPVLSDLVPQFERSSGDKVTISYATTSTLVKEIEDGITADLAILSPKQIEQLEEDDKIVEDSLIPVAKLEYGVIIRKGTTKPDVSTVHALKQTLLSAKSIAAGDPKNSRSGRYFANLIERLEFADAIKPKIRTFSPITAMLEAIANGEVDIGIGVISAANGPGTELAGVLPAQAHRFNSYAAGIVTSSNQKEAAKALANFISSSTSLALFKSKGFDAP